ncbi:MAG: VOC family protein [Bdellovibrionota bacterium]
MLTTPFQKLLHDGSLFLNALILELEKMGFEFQTLQPDHLCLRVATLEEYSAAKNLVATAATLLTETDVNGRPIASYRLHEPFVSKRGPVEILEIPSPKDGSFYPYGFEHAEFVIKESFESFKMKHPSLNFRGRQDRVLNPELSLKTACGVAKFHTSTLARVIEIEEAPIREVIFDFDGTIIDAREMIYAINAQVFSRLLGRSVSSNEARTHHAPDFPTLFKNFGIVDAAERARGMDLWAEVSHEATFPLFAGIREALEEIARLGFRMHIWTAREESSTRQIMKKHGIADYFETFGFSTAKLSKPHPDTIGFDWKQKNSGSMIVVGDSWTDMRGAHAIGAVAGAALWDPDLDLSHLCEMGAELLLRKPEDLVEYLRARAPEASRDS